jgi:hypothetical protein
MARDPAHDRLFEEAVQREVERRLADLQVQLAASVERMMKEQMARMDQAAEAAGARQEAWREDMLRQERELRDRERESLLKSIALRLHRAGQEPATIAEWLALDPDKVASWIGPERISDTKRDEEPLPVWLWGARLRYEQEGRGGRLWLECARTRFAMWWEFGGGKALVLIGMPAAEGWERETGLPLDERETVVRFVAEEALRDQAGGRGSWSWDGRTITLYNT